MVTEKIPQQINQKVTQKRGRIEFYLNSHSIQMGSSPSRWLGGPRPAWWPPLVAVWADPLILGCLVVARSLSLSPSRYVNHYIYDHI